LPRGCTVATINKEIWEEFVTIVIENFPTDKTQLEIAKECGMTSSRISNFKVGRREKLSPQELKLLMNNYNGDWDKLRKFMEKEPQLLFFYWDVLYPDCEPKSSINKIMRECIKESGYTQKEITLRTGIKQSYLSRMECGQQQISYDKIAIISHAIGMTPYQMIIRLRENVEEQKIKRYFTEYIKTIREKKKYSIQDVAASMEINAKRYEGYESGKYYMTEETIGRLANVLELDKESLIKKAREANCIKTTAVSIQERSMTNGDGEEEIKDEQRNVLTVINTLNSYEVINIVTKKGQYTKVEGHTFATLLLLILSNNFNGLNKHRNDIVYYLHRLYDKGNIAKELCFQECRDMSTGEKIDFYRRKHGFTFQTITDCKGYSRGYMCNLIANIDKIPLPICCEIPPLIGMPSSIAIEETLEKTASKSDKGRTDVLDSEDLKRWLLSTDGWKLWDEIIPSKVIVRVIDTVTEGISAWERYKKLTSLRGLPKSDDLKSSRYNKKK